jgi:hypothetical protein
MKRPLNFGGDELIGRAGQAVVKAVTEHVGGIN